MRKTLTYFALASALAIASNEANAQAKEHAKQIQATTIDQKVNANHPSGQTGESSGLKAGIGYTHFNGLSSKPVLELGYGRKMPEGFFAGKASANLYLIVGNSSQNLETLKRIDSTQVPKVGTFVTDVKGDYSAKSGYGIGGSIMAGNEKFQIGPQAFFVMGEVNGTATNIERYTNTAGVTTKIKEDPLTKTDEARNTTAFGVTSEFKLTDRLSLSAGAGGWNAKSINDHLPKESSYIAFPGNGGYFVIILNRKF